MFCKKSSSIKVDLSNLDLLRGSSDSGRNAVLSYRKELSRCEKGSQSGADQRLELTASKRCGDALGCGKKPPKSMKSESSRKAYSDALKAMCTFSGNRASNRTSSDSTRSSCKLAAAMRVHNSEGSPESFALLSAASKAAGTVIPCFEPGSEGQREVYDCISVVSVSQTGTADCVSGESMRNAASFAVSCASGARVSSSGRGSVSGSTTATKDISISRGNGPLLAFFACFSVVLVVAASTGYKKK